MSFTVIDVGASSTRFCSDNGSIMILPNNMVVVDEDARIDLEPYGDVVESALDVKIKKEEESDFFPVRALIGQMANRYSPNNIRPSVMSNKHTQKVNYISIITAVAVNKLKTGIDEDIDLYVALPPNEVNTAKDYVAEQLKGTYEVTLDKFNGEVVKFNIKSVKCFAESYMAIMAYFFNMNGTIREEAQEYAVGNVLSLDVGASTSDLAIVKDRKYLEKTGQTYKIGGNIIKDLIADYVREEFGYDIQDDVLEMAISEGRLPMGNKYVNIGKQLECAKREFASQVVNQMQNYFRKVGIALQSVRVIVVSGGGSMKSEYTDEKGVTIVTSEPASYYITEALRDICDGIDVVTFSENPRMANTIGLFIRANIDKVMKSKENKQ